MFRVDLSTPWLRVRVHWIYVHRTRSRTHLSRVPWGGACVRAFFQRLHRPASPVGGLLWAFQDRIINLRRVLTHARARVDSGMTRSLHPDRPVPAEKSPLIREKGLQVDYSICLDVESTPFRLACVMRPVFLGDTEHRFGSRRCFRFGGTRAMTVSLSGVSCILSRGACRSTN